MQNAKCKMQIERDLLHFDFCILKYVMQWV